MRMPSPGWHHEHVVLVPLEPNIIDLRVAIAFGDAVNRARGMSVGLSFLPAFQQLHGKRHRRHYRAASFRIDVFNDVTVVWIRLRRLQSLKRFAYDLIL